MADFKLTPEETLRRAEHLIAKAQREKSTVLDLGDLGLVALPDSLGNLTQLTTLYLYSNQLAALPDWLGNLSQLTTLYLSKNQLAALPDSLGNLSQLTSLNLSNNQLAALPDSLGNLSQLTSLFLYNNQLATLPDSLPRLAKLTDLFLHGNAQLDLPAGILGPTYDEVVISRKEPKPPKEILDYYFANRAGSRPLNEAKLILVGRGEVGKTSLVKKLVTGKFNSREKTTEGIRISDWDCPIGKGKNVRVHLWDFGGQEMQHATHQFFLTERALYLLVLNRRQDGCDEEADYWFRMIRAFGGVDAPVIVVLNKQKKEPFDVNRGGWLEKYASNIRGFVETDCADNASITRLKKSIQERIRAIESVHEGFPKKWFAIKDKLATMPDGYVTSRQYREICAEHGEGDAEKQKMLSRFLHDLGIALNYEKDDRLRFAYVLKPEWITGGIYALLHGFITAKGVFSLAQAEALLRKKKYGKQAVTFLVELMERFELGFALNEERTRFRIPQALEDKQPNEASTFSAERCLRFAYKYEIVPDGLLPQFIVRTEHMSKTAWRWKSGVIVRDERTGCRALVRADKSERMVRIAVDGPEAHRQDLLRVARFNFEAIHGNYKFTPVELVYPPEPVADPMKLAELRGRIEAGQTTVSIFLGAGKFKDFEAAVLDPKDPKRPLRTFLSYAHGDDEKYINAMRKQLMQMERLGLLKVWSDHSIRAGQQWEETILQELAAAELVICQISSDFLASNFCMLTELKMAIERAGRDEIVLVAYVLHECQWKREKPLAKFQLLPKGAKPISKWGSKHEYWNEIAEGIWAVAEPLQEKLAKTDDPRRMLHD